MQNGKRVLKNISYIVICRIIQSVLALVIGMISARYLGPSKYGLISYASSIVAFVLPIVQLGFRNTIVKELVSNDENEGTIIGTIIVSTLCCSMIGIAVISVIVSIFNHDSKETIIVCIIYSVSLIFQMTEMIQYWFQAKLLSKYVSIISLIAYCIVSLYKIYLLVYAKEIVWFAISNSIDYALISIILFIYYKKLGGKRLSYSYKIFKEMFSRSKYYIISGLMVTVFSQTDRVMLNNMIGEIETGYYSAAFTCAHATGFVFVAIIDSFRPIIFEKHKNHSLDYSKTICTVFAIIIYMGVIQSILFAGTSKTIISILYGSEYIEAAQILQILTWSIVFAYLGNVRNIWILAEGKQKYMWVINFWGAVINVIGNSILIPRFSACGAAFSTVMTQCFTNLVLCFIIKDLKPCGKYMLKGINLIGIFRQMNCSNKHNK